MSFGLIANSKDVLGEQITVHRFHDARPTGKGGIVMQMSTMKGIAAGSLLGLTLGAGLMMTPQGKRMKRVIAKGGPQLARQVADCWTK